MSNGVRGVAGRSPARRSGLHRWLPIAGITAAIVAVVGHFGFGAALMHVALPAALAYFGVNVASLGGGVLVVALAAAITLKLLVVFGAFRWWRQRRFHEASQGGFGTHRLPLPRGRSTASIPNGEDTMVIRTITVQTQPGQVDELVRRWREQVAPAHAETPGLRSVYVGGDRTANTVLAVQVWDTRPDQSAHERHDRLRFRDQVRDLLSAEPVVEEYELLAQS